MVMGRGGVAIVSGVVERIAHTGEILEHILFAGHLKDPSKEGNSAPFTADLEDYLEQARKLAGDHPCSRFGIRKSIEWLRFFLAANSKVGSVIW